MTPIPKAVYVAAFSLAALGCFVGAVRVRRVEVPDLRRGLTWLFALSGWWAALTAGQLLAGTLPVKTLL